MAMESASRTGRQLWQLPTFLIGIAALFAVWHARPYLRPTPAERYARDLNQLRQHLEKTGPDAAAVQSLLRRIEATPAPASLVAQARFLTGSAYVALGEAGGPTEDVATRWKAAREYLESIAPGDLPVADQQRLPYRLGKAWAWTGGVEPSKVIDAISRGLQSGDDAAEGLRLLADQYLKLTPPDPKKARDSLREYLSRASRADPGALSQARLRLGQLHNQLGELDEARKVLERIGPDAPADVYVAARASLAHSYQAEEDWNQAIRSYEQARDARGASAALRGPVFYQLAVCYLRVNRRADAIAALDQARAGSGPEGTAAAIRLAELQLRDPKAHETAAKALEAALANTTKSDQYQNEYLPLNEARAVYEEAATQYRLSGEFELALRVIRAYASIAEPGRDQELLVEVHEAWGNALVQQSLRDEGDRARLEDSGRQQFRQAAQLLQAVVEKKAPSERGESVKKAAELWVKAGDKAQATKVIKELAPGIDLPADKAGDEWLAKGEAALAAKDKGEAMQLLEKALQRSGPHLPKARLLLARLLLETREGPSEEKAIGLLEQNLSPELEKDKEIHEQSAYALAFALYQKRDWRKAELRFAQALQFYPESNQAALARFHLARCHWWMAAQEAVRIQEADNKLAAAGFTSDQHQKLQKAKDEGEERYREAVAQLPEAVKNAKLQRDSIELRYREHLMKARDPCREVEAQLLKAATTSLSPEDALLLTRASFLASECAFYLGDYEECIDRNQKLQERYAGKVEFLIAGSQLWQCYSVYLEQPDRARYALTQMREAFAKMPDDAFDSTAEIRKRSYWEKWFEQVEGGAAPMGKQ
jgi:tetratricopeptide (TPR) repeat protein